MPLTSTALSRVLPGLALALLPALGLAQTTYAPAAVTGYNADVIANGVGAVTASTTASVDRGIPIVQWCFADSSFVNPAGRRPARALPTGGLIRSISTPGLTFQLASSSQPNSLRIDGAGAGTLALLTPQATPTIKVLATEGNGSGGADKSFIIRFTDGTAQVIGGVVVPDWYSNTGATPALHVGSRVNRGTSPNYTIENNGTHPTLFEVTLTIDPANVRKLVQSITVDKTLTDPVLNIMGLSFAQVCSAPPQPTITQAPAGTLTSSTSTGNQWYYNGLPIAGATGSTYVVTSAAQNGSYTVVVTTAPGCSSPASAPQQVVLTATAAAQLSAVELTPNPAHGSCRLRVPAIGGAAAVQLQLLNALGQPVLTRTLPATGTTTELDVRGLAAGLYLVQLHAGAASTSRRLLVE
ncbi:T9SS type A sorting domain-containing protein [Hymenobacter sp. ASUV-10]|uniref:T9SS type A sorting domain-containing protein n=1 Tax=Hymenobacter aranciens TaxID=3063996 RepID=A0ABT9BH97_9BACT|nr:T9SS type A sorting domain-containing protein [Hymenobacter sp. ASUV-10]MDO7877639.1 T9SS type A sorting domain-containing protein [Hymenobacter sp. ASUV-10]